IGGMIIKNEGKIGEINSQIEPYLNMFGVSDEQNELVLKKIYGLQLKKMRLMRGYTQTRVAKAINVTFQQIQKYEKGKNAVSKVSELKLSEFLNCDVDYFIEPLKNNDLKFLRKRVNNYDYQVER
ncbi:MAG: helix-turn-helix transcriptional regulator, partial [Euryarchaeota archaeon]